VQTVSTSKVVSAQGAVEEPLPPRIQEALGQLVGAAKEGLLALSVGVGLGVLEELMAEEVDEVCGPRYTHDPDRVAYRHGTDDGEVTLGARRVQVERPRMRSKDGESEVPCRTYEHFASRDQLSRMVLERMLAGVSTRRYRRLQEPVGEEVEQAARSTSKSAVSRSFVARTREALLDLMARRLDDLRLAVLMIDGIGLKDHTCVVALGITTDGVKIPLGLWEGSTENKTVSSELLTNLVARGLDVEQGVLVVIDGSKALRAAVKDVLGTRTPVQRCTCHKERNLMDHLPERDRDLVKRRLRRAWAETSYRQALEQLQTLAAELDRSHPGAAASLREGMAETLTVTRLGVKGSLKKTLATTNPCESMIECVRRSSRNVKHWQNGEMCLRWTAAGMLEAEQQFRRVIGYQELAKLASAVEREVTLPQPNTAPTEDAAIVTAA
jgi:transposase-like protein